MRGRFGDNFDAERHYLTHPGLELLALVVQLAQAAEVGLGLVLEECVVQHLVVDVQLAHLALQQQASTSVWTPCVCSFDCWDRGTSGVQVPLLSERQVLVLGADAKRTCCNQDR